MGIAFMSDNDNNHKHHYIYVFTSIINDFDIKAISSAYHESTKPSVSIGETCAFYECKDCGKMLITEEF